MRILKCASCVHYEGRGKCPAYPERIPKEIVWWQTPHDQVLPGQVGDFVFEHKDPVLERDMQRKGEAFRKELFENKEKYRREFSDLVLRQLKENELADVNWQRIVLDINQKRGWDTVMERVDFYVETDTETIPLDLKYIREWRSIRKRLWILKNIKDDKDYVHMNFILDRSEGLQIIGLDTFKLPTR